MTLSISYHTLVTCAFPHLFPFGAPPSMPRSTFPESLTRYLMLHHQCRFSTEIPLVFLLFNQAQRHANMRSTSLKLKASKTHVQAIMKISGKDDFFVKLADANADPESPQAKAFLAQIRPDIMSFGNQAPFSPAARRLSFNHLMACMNR